MKVELTKDKKEKKLDKSVDKWVIPVLYFNYENSSIFAKFIIRKS